VFTGGGSDVSIFDVVEGQLAAARDHVSEHTQTVRQILGLGQAPQGRVNTCTRLEQAVHGAWIGHRSRARAPRTQANSVRRARQRHCCRHRSGQQLVLNPRAVN
jgi:hypothetical protein